MPFFSKKRNSLELSKLQRSKSAEPKEEEHDEEGGILELRAYGSCGDLFETTTPPSSMIKKDLGGARGFLHSAQSQLNLKEKISSQKKRKRLKTPVVTQQLLLLISLFPDFPLPMFWYLCSRYEGNLSTVYDFLISRSWEPITKAHCAFANEKDVHFITPYYFGYAPSQTEKHEIFKKADIGAYITFYSLVDNTSDFELEFQYVLCYKNANGNIVEKPAVLPTVPDVLKKILQLSNPICRNQFSLPQGLPLFQERLRKQEQRFQ